MEHGSTITTILLFLTFSVHLSSADTHSLQYLYTAVTGIHFPEFTAVALVNGEQIVYYDSNIKKVILKTEWAKKIGVDHPDHWNGAREIFQSRQAWFKDNVATAMQSFNQTKGIHTAQFMFGCELDDDGTTRGYTQYGYDGEDFISLDLKGVSWIAAKPQAVITERKWKSTGYEAKYCKDFLTHGCVERLKIFLSYGRETLERKDRPKASVFQKHSSPPEVVCHATGFFPKAVNITWQKDGEDVHEDVELRETLPNQDGSFQKRSVLRVPAEELQKHTYTCVIQHSSLEKEIVLIERRTIKGGGSDGGSDGGQIANITGVVVAFVALIAIVAGIVVWKKKNSGFRPVPQKSMLSSEGDSSSNSS